MSHLSCKLQMEPDSSEIILSVDPSQFLVDPSCDDEAAAELALFTAELAATAHLQPAVTPRGPTRAKPGNGIHQIKGLHVDDIAPLLEQLKHGIISHIDKSLATRHEELFQKLQSLTSLNSKPAFQLSSLAKHSLISASRNHNLKERRDSSERSGSESRPSTLPCSERCARLDDKDCTSSGISSVSGSQRFSSVSFLDKTCSEKTETRKQSHFSESRRVKSSKSQKRSIPTSLKAPIRHASQTAKNLILAQGPKEDRMLHLALGDKRETLRYERSNTTLDFNERPMPKASFERSGISEILHSSAFELGMGAAVLTNAVFIGLEVNHMATHQGTTASSYFQYVSYFYAALFLVELILRLVENWWTFLWKTDAKTLTWNYLDIGLVTASVLEAVFDIASVSGIKSGRFDPSNMRILRVLRVFRLIRLLRIARFVRFVRALRTLVYSICCTLKSVFWAMVLLTIIMYVFAVLFTQASMDDPSIPNLERYWGRIDRGMLSLFMCISNGISWIEVLEPLSSLGSVWTYFFLTYLGFTYFAVLNVVTGVFCHAAMEGNSEDQDHMLHTVMRHRQLYTERFMEIFNIMAKNHSGKITLHEFLENMDSDDVKNYFASLDLQCEDALGLFHLFQDGTTKGVDVDEFVIGCLRLKGTARGSDMVRLLHEHRIILDHMDRIADHLQIAAWERSIDVSRPIFEMQGTAGV